MRSKKGLFAGLMMLGMSVACMLGTSVTAEEYYEEYYDDGQYYDDGYYDEGYYEEYEEPAEEKDGDNSLSSLGLSSEYQCSPEFAYNHLEYDITVPAGTTRFEVDPVKSSSKAELTNVTGTTLDDDGTGTVEITVTAENGSAVTYYLRVKPDAAQTEAAVETEAAQEAVAETTAETESAKKEEAMQNAKDKLALQAAESEKAVLASEKSDLEYKVAQLQQKEGQVNVLQTENDDLAYRLNLLMKVLYGLIAFAVILLFFIINQSLRNKDMKDDIKKTKAELEDVKTSKPVVPTTDFYYAPAQQPAAKRVEASVFASAESSEAPVFAPAESSEAPVFASAESSEAPVFESAESSEAPVFAPAESSDAPMFVPAEPEEAPLSRRAQKKLEKEAKRAAKLEAKQARKNRKANITAEPEEQAPLFVEVAAPEQPITIEHPAAVEQPVVFEPIQEDVVSREPQLVVGKVKEPDVKVDMIDL